MLVREVMTWDPVSVRADTSTREALLRLDEHAVTSLPVTGSDGRLVGVVSEADLVRGVLPRDPRAHLRTPRTRPHAPPPSRVGDVMTYHPLTVTADVDLAEAVEVMTSTSLKSLPVVDGDGRVVGMLSRSDVVHLLARLDERADRDPSYLALRVDWLVQLRDDER